MYTDTDSNLKENDIIECNYMCPTLTLDMSSIRIWKYQYYRAFNSISFSSSEVREIPYSGS